MMKMTEFLTHLLDAVKSIFAYLLARSDQKKADQKKKAQKKLADTMNDIIDNGSLDDLLKAMKLVFSAILIAFAVGCRVENVNIVTTGQWEGHYFSVEEFKKATEDISLRRNESIWVMSNTTFKKIINDILEKRQ